MCFIKKIEFNNYGPFNKQEMSFDNSNSPYFIVGLNDVGKSAILEGIYSLKNGLGQHYYVPNSTPNSYIKFEIKIREKFYEQFQNQSLKYEKFILNWQEIFSNIFCQNVQIIIKQTSPIKNLNFEVFQNSPDLKYYIETVILPKINELLKLAPHQPRPILLKDLRDDNLEKLLLKFPNQKPAREENIYGEIQNEEEINNYENYPKLYSKINKALNLINTFKKFLLFIFIDKIKFLKSWNEREFEYLISKHNLSNDGDLIDGEIGKIGNIKTAAKFISSFTNATQKQIEHELHSIIKSDYDEETKKNALLSKASHISTKINQFFADYFPQNGKIFFSLEIEQNHVEGSYYLNIRVSDIFHNDVYKYLDFHKRGEGFKWFLKLYVIMSNLKEYDIILIDELEKFLNLATLESLTRLMATKIDQKNITFILATHSPNVINFKNSSNTLSNTSNWFDFFNLFFVMKESGVSSIQKIDDLRYQSQNNLFKIIYQALGFNLYDLISWNKAESKNNKVIFVEGIADFYTIKVAEYFATQNQSITNKIYFWPLWGTTISNNVAIARMLKLNFKIFLDGSKQKFREKSKNVDLEDEYFVFLGDKMRDKHITIPEDLLSSEDLNKIQILFNDDGSRKHCQYWLWIWKKIREDNNYLSTESKNNLKQYFSIIRNMFN